MYCSRAMGQAKLDDFPLGVRATLKIQYYWSRHQVPLCQACGAVREKSSDCFLPHHFKSLISYEMTSTTDWRILTLGFQHPETGALVYRSQVCGWEVKTHAASLFTSSCNSNTEYPGHTLTGNFFTSYFCPFLLFMI